MKRAGHLLEAITEWHNLRAAFHSACKGKNAKADVLAYREQVDANLERLRRDLLGGTVSVGGYRQFKVYDPKERVITVAPFGQRVLHHVVMRVCEPVFERHLIFHTYACRKGKGRIAALDVAERFGRTHPYYLKLDIRKYFDSVDHGILKAQLRRLFKDPPLLALLDAIIDSFCVQPGKGLPIGNLTSQHFANLYLSPLDRMAGKDAGSAELKHIRYMDDMVVWGRDRQALAALRSQMRTFLSEHLALELKQDRIGAVANGVPFLGCRVFAGYRTFNVRSKRRFRHKIKLFDRLLHEGRIDEAEAQQRAQAVCAFAKTACSYDFRQHVLAPHFRATAMGETCAPTATSAAAPGTTTRTTAPSRTGTTTTRTTGTTTTDSGSPAAQERSWMRPVIPGPAVFQSQRAP
jgi:RNA-directed DNA polymerase